MNEEKPELHEHMNDITTIEDLELSTTERYCNSNWIN